jgi:cellulose synthase/poly-beta-1,6-N-acetylglucosamine synthase-like glycosyltransferase
MRYVMLAIRALLTLATAWLAGLTGYLLLLTGAAVRGRRQALPPDAARLRRFALLVPAHDEEQTIGRLLTSIRALDYPAGRFDTYVVADNCTDRTAEIARAAGAQVEERYDPTARGKGYALRWLLARMRERGARFDAYVVLDADTVVESSLLRRLDARFEAGSRVVQVYYTVLNAGESPVAALRFAALAAVHYLRPLGRARLGLSCGLKGNGMAFLAEVLDRYGWEWFTLAEDVELHLALVEAGLRVDFAPETTVMAEMPVTFAQAESQNERWERGRLEMLRERGLSLLLDGLRQRDPVRLDAVAEQVIPPLSVPVLLAGAALLAGLVTRSRAATVLAAFSLGGQLAYVLTALALVKAPWRIYGALAYAPGYVGWKVWLYARSMLVRDSGAWVRTERNSAAEAPSPSDPLSRARARGSPSAS